MSLDTEKYFTYLRSVKKSIELFREENIPLQAELSVATTIWNDYRQNDVEVNGKEYTLQQAAKFLESMTENYVKKYIGK